MGKSASKRQRAAAAKTAGKLRQDSVMPSLLDPPLKMDSLNRPLERAIKAIGRLEGVASILPSAPQLLYMYMRKEALLSCQIDGSHASLVDLLLFQHDAIPGMSLVDVQRVSNYVAAMQLGLGRLGEGEPISWNLLQDLQGALLKNELPQSKKIAPWPQRATSLNRPGSRCLPPRAQVPALMADLEAFINTDTPAIPALVKVGLIHLQYTAIHPLGESSALMGRLLVMLLLCSQGALAEPILYFSLHFKTHEQQYADLFQQVRDSQHDFQHGSRHDPQHDSQHDLQHHLQRDLQQDGDTREAWLALFLDGIHESAVQATETVTQMLALFARDRAQLQRLGSRQAAMPLRLHEMLQERAVTTVADSAKRLQSTFPTVVKAIQSLEGLEMLSETTGKRLGRMYAYGEYVELLAKGTEVL